MISVQEWISWRVHASSKWGNSFAIRLPGSVVQALELKEGDEIVVHVVGDRAFDIVRDRSRERVLELMRAFRKQLPADWRFDREEANAR
jgi:antitoxin MazE